MLFKAAVVFLFIQFNFFLSTSIVVSPHYTSPFPHVYHQSDSHVKKQMSLWGVSYIEQLLMFMCPPPTTERQTLIETFIRLNIL